MAQYDGRVLIDTQINTKNASAQLMTLENRIVKTADKIASLRSKMDALKDVQIPTQEYKSIETDIAKAETELGKLIEKQSQMQNEGKDSGAAWDRLNQRIQASKDYIEIAREEMQQLVNEGKAFTLGKDTDQYANLSQQLQYAESEMIVLNQRHDELIAKQNKNVDGYKKIGKAARDGAKTASKAVKGMSDSMKVGLKNILKYGIGIRSLYVLINKLRSAIKEGFSNLYNDANMADFKNQVDSLRASLLTLKNSFAAAFRPLVESAIPYIQKTVEWINVLLDKLGQFIALASGQKKYTKAIKQTADAFKDAKKAADGYLSPLDEINKFKSPESSDSGAGSETMFEEVPVDNKILDFLQKIKDFLQPVIEYAEKLKGIFLQGFFDGLGDWEYRWESIKESIGTIKDSLIDIWTDPAVLSAADSYNQSVAYMLGSLAGSMVSVGLTIATNLVGGIAKYLKQNKDRIKNFLISMFDIGAEINRLIAEFSQAFAFIFEVFAGEEAQQLTANLIGIFTDAVMGTLEILGKLARDILNIFIQPFVDNKEEFRTALEGFLSVLSEVTGTIKQGIDDTFDKLNEVYDEHFKPFFDSIADGLSDTVGKFLEFWNGSVQPILDEWATKFDQLWKEHIQPMLDKFVSLLGDAADFLKVVWENVLKPLIDWIIENVLPVILPIIDGVVKAIGSAAGMIADVIGGIIDVISGILQFLTGVFTGDWKKAWDGIVKIFSGVGDVIKGIVNGILTVIESLANGVINGINFVIGALNNLSFDIPDWVPALGGKKFGFSIPELPEVSIPRLATGTVIPPNKEFLAVLGDQKSGTNIEAPLETIKQALREEALSLGLIGGNAGNGNLTLKVYLHDDNLYNDKKIFEATIRQGKIEQMSTGKNRLLLEN